MERRRGMEGGREGGGGGRERAAEPKNPAAHACKSFEAHPC